MPSSSGTSTGSIATRASSKSSSRSATPPDCRALASVTGDTDLATHDGRFLARILGAVARKESDDKSRRITRKHLEIAQAGRAINGGTRPYGYRDDFRDPRSPPRPATVIREAAARVLAGDSLRSIAADPQRPRDRTASAAEDWSTIQVLRRMLVSARLSGQRSIPRRDRRDRRLGADPDPRRDGPSPGAPDRSGPPHPADRPALPPLGWTAALWGLRCRPRRPPASGTAPAATSAPRVRGCPAAARSRSSPSRLRGVDLGGRPLPPRHPELAAALAGAALPDDTAERADLARDQAQLEELATAYGERAVTFREYLAARKPIEARIERARRTLARATGTAALEGYGRSLPRRPAGGLERPAVDPSARDRRRRPRPGRRPASRPRGGRPSTTAQRRAPLAGLTEERHRRPDHRRIRDLHRAAPAPRTSPRPTPRASAAVGSLTATTPTPPGDRSNPRYRAIATRTPVGPSMTDSAQPRTSSGVWPSRSIFRGWKPCADLRTRWSPSAICRRRGPCRRTSRGTWRA